MTTPIEQNIADRKTAEQLHKQLGEFAIPELATMTEQARTIFWSLMKATALKQLGEGQCRQLNNNSQSQQKSDRPRSVTKALEIVEWINDNADDVPSKGADFADSVRDKANDIGETIEQMNHVTDAQLEALENMQYGLSKWLHD